MPSLWEQSAADLLRAASNHQAAPGGGGTAALSGAFGAALVHMAAVISRQKALKAEGTSGDWDTVMAELDGHLRALRALADADVEAFGQFVEAVRQPRTTEEEQVSRAEALEEAGDLSRAVPLRIEQACVETLGAAERLLPHTHPQVVSDVGAGAALLRGALDAALLTLEINLRRLNEEERRPLQAERDRLAAAGHEGAARVLAGSRQRIVSDNG